jgi:hypothetical protein
VVNLINVFDMTEQLKPWNTLSVFTGTGTVPIRHAQGTSWLTGFPPEFICFVLTVFLIGQALLPQ